MPHLFNLNGTQLSEVSIELETDSELDIVHFWIYGVLMTCIIIMGLLGNTLTIWLFLSPTIWSCLSFYLVALAVWDSALLISAFANWSLWSIWTEKSIPLIGNHVSYLRVSYYFANCTLTGCVWVTVCLTAERYFAILWPLHHRTFDNECRAKILIGGVSILSLVVNLPRLFEVDVVDSEIYYVGNSYNLTDIHPLPEISKSEMYSDPIYFILYRVIGNSLLTYWLPNATVLVMTTRMCIALRRAVKRRSSTVANLQANSLTDPKMASLAKSKSSETQNTNVTLVIVLVKCLLCNLLPSVIDLIELTVSDTSYAVELLITVSNLLVVLNSSLNFYIYTLQCRRFKLELRRLFIRRNYKLERNGWRFKSRYTRRLTCANATWQYGSFSLPESQRNLLNEMSGIITPEILPKINRDLDRDNVRAHVNTHQTHNGRSSRSHTPSPSLQQINNRHSWGYYSFTHYSMSDLRDMEELERSNRTDSIAFV